MQRIRRSRGILIISVLFITLLVSMFVGAALELGPWSLRRALNQSDVSAAKRAARSGVEYALARLKNDVNWNGPSFNQPRQVVVNTPELVVVEDQGNVIGLVRNENQVAQFRIRFNYQDGAGNADGRPDSGLPIATSYLSCNHVTGSTERLVPRADGPNYSVPANPTTHVSLPGHSLFLTVEGRCGDYLRVADAQNPDPQPGFGSYSTARLESLLKVTNVGQAATPAVAATANSFTATLPTGSNSVKLDSADKTEIGRLRSKSGLTINNGAANNLTAHKSGEYRVGGTLAATPSSTVTSGTEVAGEGLYKIAWDDVKRAVPTTTNTLKAGTYVYWDDGSLHYYDMSPSDYQTFMANPVNHSNAGTLMTVSNLPASVRTSTSGSGSSLNAKLEILSDTAIEATANTSDFAIMPRKGAAGGPGAPGSATISLTPTQMATALLSPNNPMVNNISGNWNMSAELSRTLYAANGGQSSWQVGGNVFNNLGQPAAQASVQNVLALSQVATALISYMQSNPQNQDVVAVVNALGGTITGGAGLQDDIPAVPASAAEPKNITLEFNPTGTSAVLSGPGEVRIGAKLQGEGASITAEGDINLLGLGVNMSALANSTEGVSLYSKQDVFISTFEKPTNKYKDVSLKGVVYCWGDFKAVLGSSSVTNFGDWGKLKITGAMVAYGQDPQLDYDPNSPPSKGNIDVTAEEVELKFDSAYLLDLVQAASLPPSEKIQYGRVWWTQE
jgi:hypothetical protein